jgi:hypothetical protein
MRYIVVWRRSPTARYLDVQLDDTNNIRVTEDRDEATRLIETEQELVDFISGTDLDTCQVEAGLAHRVLGWSIPSAQ